MSTYTHNLREYSVSEISNTLKVMIEQNFTRVKIRGEISGFKQAASGHLYFSLKDENAVLDSICWRSTATKLTIPPEDGMEIIATGRITTFSGRSKYQIIVESVELAGEGALLKLLEDRKRKLAHEGLFDQDKKRKLPYLPENIGIITSPTGAVIKDILHRLSDRFPRRVLLWPVQVQGDNAAKEIELAIHGFNRIKNSNNIPQPNLIIVARGGGSLEDLWAFNEESVVRATADSVIPIISAIGHETDWTLIDLAADVRAPTPTAAAEIAVPVRTEILTQIQNYDERLKNSINKKIHLMSREVRGLSRGLPEPRRKVEEASQKLDNLSERLIASIKQDMVRKFEQTQQTIPRPHHLITHLKERLLAEVRGKNIAIKNILKRSQQNLHHLHNLLESYSHKRVLERGYTLIFNEKHQTIGSASKLKPNQHISILFHDKRIPAKVTGRLLIEKKIVAESQDDEPQGSLI